MIEKKWVPELLILTNIQNPLLLMLSPANALRSFQKGTSKIILLISNCHITDIPSQTAVSWHGTKRGCAICKR